MKVSLSKYGCHGNMAMTNDMLYYYLEKLPNLDFIAVSFLMFLTHNQKCRVGRYSNAFFNLELCAQNIPFPSSRDRRFL